MKCKTCEKDIQKEPVVRAGGVRFVDDQGRLWNGKVCPSCYKEYNRERMRIARKKLKEVKN